MMIFMVDEVNCYDLIFMMTMTIGISGPMT